MTGKYLRNEPWLYAGALLLAVAFRLINLGSLPLDDREAVEALKALQILGGSAPTSGQPLYTLFTAGLFTIFGNSNFLARLVPALAGCLLVALPVLLRKDLGRLPALILAYGLALDPALVAISRQAGSVMPAVSFSLMALFFLWKQKWRPAGIFTGLAVLSGTAFWFGLIGLLLAFLGVSLFGKRDMQEPQTVAERSWFSRPGKEFWLAFVVTIALGGSLFLTLPAGINLIVSGLLDYINGWVTASGITIQRVVIPLIIGQLGILLLGLTEGISGWIQSVPSRRIALLTFLTFLTLLVLYPGRQIQDTAWSVILLWVLAAWLLSRLADTPHEVVLPILGHAALLAALILFIIINISNVLGGFGALDVVRILTLLGGLVVIIIISFLVAYGWGIDVAARGALVGAGLVAVTFMISLSISAGGVNARSSPDLWHPKERVVGADALLGDLNAISKWNTGQKSSLTVEVINFDSPALRWLLRDFQNTRYLDTLIPGETSDIIITDFTFRPELASTYRGEAIDWYATTDWSTLDGFGYLDWVFHRKTAETPTTLILWVRQDLFVTGSQSLTPDQSVIQ
jgi:4-amino-4-deoxy-L-arabinose transferase-like glycosyltransferase